MAWWLLLVLVGCGSSASDPAVASDSGELVSADADVEDAGTVDLMGFRDAGELSDGALPEPDAGGAGGMGGADAGSAGSGGSVEPELPGLCEPCEGTCEGTLRCLDFGAIGHTASAGQGAYCVPPCDTYAPQPGDNPACDVFSNYRCLPGPGGCRPYAYPALDGIADQCAAFLTP